MSENNSIRRSYNRAAKRRDAIENHVGEEKKIRSCEKTGCYASEPTCCLLSCESCTKDGYTSRWYHMSLGEHFCNNCFCNFYISGKTGNLLFNQWINKWAEVARASKPTIKRFVANELLPYWVKCTRRQCGKWRMVRVDHVLDPKFIKSFKCPEDSKHKSPCDAPEDKDVSLVLDTSFMNQLIEEPHLQNSPAGPFLKRFLSEDIGLCPINNSVSALKEHEYVKPFLMEQCGESCIWIKPDEMDEDEIAFSNQVLVSPATYLGLRNFLVALWNLKPNEWLSFQKANEYLICRGLVRIYLVSVAEQILDLLTKKSVINHGIINNPSQKLLKKNPEPEVLVIGAGISGLAAASHLHNLGVNVAVYEAEGDLGGRIKDVPVLGAGAFFIHGLLNNPLTTFGLQVNVPYQNLKKNLVIFKENGSLISNDIIKKTQHELNNLLQGVIESVSVSKTDDNCFDMVTKSCEDLRKVTPFCKNADIFSHLLTHCEIDFKAHLKNMSILNWEFPVCSLGDDGFIPSGMRLFLIKLASKDYSIVYNNEVKVIDYIGDKVKVTTTNGESIFSKVLITVPLSVLQNDCIQFIPELPDYKKKAICDLGTYNCEKLILEFPRKFWTKNVNEPFSRFGILSSEAIFEVFYDVTDEKPGSKPTLVTFITEKAFDLIKDLEDKEIFDKCLALLKRTFRRNIPQPSNWHLTHWRKKVQYGSFGSYLKVGSQQTAYDDMAKSVDDKLYFAGEATFRNLPSTVTGAYLSGLREAAKIVKALDI
ncbi:lysine-specific histone demethylase 2-like [Argiope bruennichi]|uniref:Lysine-specific histone demethylase 1B like protein n=1 Tax=Argiope bruennichi TaxID=94029 RepID=A0A8T0E6Q6_ARGBR|nr:lysine-specific histone demethylase 2-like [Argiope bruennichi]KAF8767174.1 Lysine-specific histone demethylase 1B like protein [Argiope bruennichi]